MDQLNQVIAKDDYVPIVVLTGDNTLSRARTGAFSRGARFCVRHSIAPSVQLRVQNLLQTRSCICN